MGKSSKKRNRRRRPGGSVGKSGVNKTQLGGSTAPAQNNGGNGSNGGSDQALAAYSPTAQPAAASLAATPPTPTKALRGATSGAWMDSLWFRLVAAAALCLLTVGFLFPALQGGFVWDDAAFTTVAPVQNWSGIWKIWFQSGSLIHEGHFWPILYTTFWLEHKLWGFGSPLPFHIFNVVLHCGAVLLLWRLLVHLAVPGAWLAAAIFAIHPTHVESVAWVIGRKDIIATLFYLSAAFCYIRYVETACVKRRYYLWALGLCLGSLLSKYFAVTLPAALLVWHWWKYSRITVHDVQRVFPFLLLGLFITLADWAVYKSREIVYFGFTIVERFVIAAKSLCFYIGQLVWPSELAVVYPKWNPSIGEFTSMAALAAVVAVPAALWFARRHIGRGALAGLLFFAITVSPTLGLLDYGYMQFSFVADRYQYLAGVGVTTTLVAVAVCALRYCYKVLPGLGRYALLPLGLAASVAVLAALGNISWGQSGIYKTQGTLFSHIVARNPDARGAHHSLGFWHQQRGRLQEALANYEIATKKRPNNAKIINKMGMVYEALGDPASAEVHYRRARLKDPRFKNAINNLALLQTRQGKYQESMNLFREVLQLDGKFASAYNGLGIAQYNLKRYEEALGNFDKALQLNPNLVDARNNRQLVQQFLQMQESGQQPQPVGVRPNSQGAPAAAPQPTSPPPQPGQQSEQ